MRIRAATPADSADIARVQIDVWNGTYRDLVPDAFLVAMSHAEKRDHWQSLIADGENFVLVAETHDRQIVGFACAGPNRDVKRMFTGELHQLYLRPEWQGRGIGRQLVKAVAGRLLERNLTSMIVWVLGGNPFRAFYESLDGEYLARRTIHIGGAPLLDIAYGWRESRRLLDH